jgi:hypothetical protein
MNGMRYKMKKIILALLVLIVAGSYAGHVGLPEEHLALNELQGDYLVCIWDETADDWYTGFASYDHSGAIRFQVPRWDRWYWIGLWDETKEEYVFGKWIGYFVTHGNE